MKEENSELNIENFSTLKILFSLILLLISLIVGYLSSKL
jgi:hypothetical protein